MVGSGGALCLDGSMSSSDSPDAPDAAPDAPDGPDGAADFPTRPEPIASTDIDPAIAEAVDMVGNRFGAQGLEQMIDYAQDALSVAREALDELANAVEQ
jgi:hypothetical protein